ncbi:MAG: hypothetical protein IJZ85_04020 [Lachnospiraceae bacterium]|nr:hypothetical protein [Lachnospiraceae bacterium]
MKYMHFNSSCPYAGLANLLELQGAGTEDYKIALEMNLPYFLHYDKVTGYYQAGPSLQSAEWFDLYLNPRGFRYIEKICRKAQLFEIFQKEKQGVMLGLQVSEHSRHAVIFLEEKEGKFVFLNNKWEQSPEPEYLELTGTELSSRIPEKVVVGYLEPCEAKCINYASYYDEAVRTWESLRGQLHRFMDEVQSVDVLRESMNRLFRPLLLDGLTMMQLLEEEQLVLMLRDIRNRYLEQLRKNQPIRLADHLDCAMIDKAIAHIIKLISRKISDGSQ